MVCEYLLQGEYTVKLIIRKGGKGSGDFGHAGRPGQVGGSASTNMNNADLNMRNRIINDPEVLAHLRIPKVLYHVTSRKYADEILRKGLHKYERSTVVGQIRGVYLTDDPKHTYEYQEFDFPPEDAVVVSIRTDGLELRLDPEYASGLRLYPDNARYHYTNLESAIEYVESINSGDEEFALYSRRAIPSESIISIEDLYQ